MGINDSLKGKTLKEQTELNKKRQQEKVQSNKEKEQLNYEKELDKYAQGLINYLTDQISGKGQTLPIELPSKYVKKQVFTGFKFKKDICKPSFVSKAVKRPIFKTWLKNNQLAVKVTTDDYYVNTCDLSIMTPSQHKRKTFTDAIDWTMTNFSYVLMGVIILAIAFSIIAFINKTF